MLTIHNKNDGQKKRTMKQKSINIIQEWVSRLQKPREKQTGCGIYYYIYIDIELMYVL